MLKANDKQLVSFKALNPHISYKSIFVWKDTSKLLIKK